MHKDKFEFIPYLYEGTPLCLIRVAGFIDDAKTTVLNTAELEKLLADMRKLEGTPEPDPAGDSKKLKELEAVIKEESIFKGIHWPSSADYWANQLLKKFFTEPEKEEPTDYTIEELEDICTELREEKRPK